MLPYLTHNQNPTHSVLWCWVVECWSGGDPPITTGKLATTHTTLLFLDSFFIFSKTMPNHWAAKNCSKQTPPQDRQRPRSIRVEWRPNLETCLINLNYLQLGSFCSRSLGHCEKSSTGSRHRHLHKRNANEENATNLFRFPESEPESEMDACLSNFEVAQCWQLNI